MSKKKECPKCEGTNIDKYKHRGQTILHCTKCSYEWTPNKEKKK